MPIIVIVTIDAPAESKDKFLAAWPTIKADVAAQSGALGVSGGQVIAENGAPVTNFKFIQTMAFKSAEDHQAFADSAWAKGESEKATERLGGAPNVRRFETPDFPDATPKALTQYSFIELSDASKNVEARQFWIDFVTAVGSESFGGRSVDDKPVTGLGLLGWDSIEAIAETYKKPEVAAAWERYKSVGKNTNMLVKPEA